MAWRMVDQPNIDSTVLRQGALDAPSALRANAFRAKPLYFSQLIGLAYGLPTFLVGLAASAMTVYLALHSAVTETLLCAAPALLGIWAGARTFKHAVAPSWRHIDTLGIPDDRTALCLEQRRLTGRRSRQIAKSDIERVSTSTFLSPTPVDTIELRLRSGERIKFQPLLEDSAICQRALADRLPWTTQP
jgi:hypothetical protein